MRAKQLQNKHWLKSKYDSPHVDTLSKLWSRAGVLLDTNAMRVFRLELWRQ